MPIEIESTEIPDVKVVRVGAFSDHRGFFSETYSEPMWAEAGFHETFRQDNLSLSARGVMRGLHYQIDPDGMGKLVRAITGGVFDVAVDLRRGSPTFGQWVGRELTSENMLALWVPVGFAHGFVSLEDNTYVYYKCTGVHRPEAERAVNYKDPAIGIEWPIPPSIVSKKDEDAPFLEDAQYNFTY
jgi:dTDP-4-dehydrorhamnose 3,5-epimerase